MREAAAAQLDCDHVSADGEQRAVGAAVDAVDARAVGPADPHQRLGMHDLAAFHLDVEVAGCHQREIDLAGVQPFEYHPACAGHHIDLHRRVRAREFAQRLRQDKEKLNFRIYYVELIRVFMTEKRWILVF